MASYAEAFDMNIQYYDPYVNSKKFHKCEKLMGLLEASDIITIHVHLNEETENLLNETNILFIKTNALLINTSRGKIWNEELISKSILNNNIAGVATDVLSTEIEDIKKSPLWGVQREGKKCYYHSSYWWCNI